MDEKRLQQIEQQFSPRANRPGDYPEAVQELVAEVRRLRALIEIVNEAHNLGDAVYDVREREGLGWDGPQVTAYTSAIAALRASGFRV